MNDRNGGSLSWIGWAARSSSLVLILYWGLFALVAPVTNYDSQVYNLARLPIAELAGLFGNSHWTNPRQLMFPWAFDAIHLPFLHLGFGFGLPSFCCLLGILAVAWSFLARRHGREAGWIGVLALLGLPTLVYQAVITKNDIPVLFGVAVSFHSMRRWRGDGRRIHLLFAALAVGFTSGAKTSGLLPAAICAGVSLWMLRRAAPKAGGFLVATLVSVLLLGSVETYVASYRQYGDPLGPTAFERDHRNRDGLRGAAASAIRYAMGNLCLGVEIWQAPDRVTPRLEASCGRLLKWTGLRNVGYRSDFDDNRIVFSKTGDSGSDYGPLGVVCLGVLALGAVWWRPQDDWWRFWGFAALAFSGICYSVAWMQWNDRFLLVSFGVLTVALVCLVYGHLAGHGLVTGSVLLLSLYAAVAYPLVSYNKRPADLVACLADRTVEEFKERSSLQPAYDAAHSWQQAHPGGRLYLVAGEDSWILPFLTFSRQFTWPVRSESLPAVLGKSLRDPFPSALLVMDRGDFVATGLPLSEIRAFPGGNTWLFEVAPGGRGPGRRN